MSRGCRYVRLIAGFVVGLAARGCGGTAVSVAEAALQRLRLPEACGIASLSVVPRRSPGQDTDPAGCALVPLMGSVGVICPPSPRGAEANAHGGIA